MDVVGLPAAVGAPPVSAAHRGSVDLVEQFRPAWLELIGRAERDEPFYHPEWISAYLGAFEPPSTLVLITAHREGRLSAVVPLVEERTWFCGVPVTKLRGAANVHTCRFDLVCEPGPAGEESVGALWRTLKALRNWDVIEFPYAPAACAASHLLGFAEKDGYLTGRYGEYPVPFIRLEGIADPWEIPHHPDFRRKMRRKLRKAEAESGVRVIRAEASDARALEQFYRVEASGWKGRKRTAILNEPRTRRFYDRIATLHGVGGQAVIYLMYFGEIPVACRLGIEHKQCYYALKTGYDESYSTYGPGHMLLGGVLKDILGRGFRELDFTGSLLDWHGEWTRDLRWQSVLYIFRKGVFGNALYTAKLKMMAAARHVLSHTTEHR
jgi:CelD/BcsL family acetyltransferase involved in cellulose biosynthesis